MGKRNTKNTLLTKPNYLGTHNISCTIELIQYDETTYAQKNISEYKQLRNLIDPQKINWFKIKEISEVEKTGTICKEFDLHTFDLKDLLAEENVIKVVNYDTVNYILTTVFSNKDENMEETQIAFILGDNFVVSLQEADLPIFEEVHIALQEGNILMRKRKSDYLLYILLNAVNSSNYDTSTHLEDKLSAIEDEIQSQAIPDELMKLLRTYRINYTHMRRSIISFREEFSNLLHNTNKLIQQDDSMVYFEDYDDRLRTTLSNLDGFREAFLSLQEMYYNNNNLQMNKVIKRLTIISTIFIPLTFLVGVWGMNFNIMPELEWKLGYLFAWSALFSVFLLTILLMKKAKWF